MIKIKRKGQIENLTCVYRSSLSTLVYKQIVLNRLVNTVVSKLTKSIK
jgi:hypothetical protein